MITAGTGLPASAKVLRVVGVTRRFGGVVAVSDASLSVAVGEIHGLIGPNGAGKSTMIGLISGFLRPDTGSVTFGAHDLTRFTPSAIAGLGVSRTFQQATPLVGLTVLENVLVGMHTRYRSGALSVLLRTPSMQQEARSLAEAARELLEEFDLGDAADSDAGDLTFGKLRFLEIARAVAMRPQILLLDEPAAGLNTMEAERLDALIRGLRGRGMGVLLVDHVVPFIFKMCDHVTVMDSGRVIAEGKPDHIYRDPAVRAAYLGEERST